MRFTFRDRYRLLWRAVNVALSPTISEATFVWRDTKTNEIVPHAFFTPDKEGIALILDYVPQCLGHSSTIEELNTKACNLYLPTAKAFAEAQGIPIDGVLVRQDMFVLRTTDPKTLPHKFKFNTE